ncbi:ABC transporter substrate-binding protein [Candidatus Woesearchaeota archaeon]|nr:ABC transporter substrate-binding protein [Candidatus Woesearchaeota archaeon]
MKKIIFTMMAIIIIIGCTPTEKIKIGAILPLTGKGAYIGEPTLKGLMLALEGSDVQLIVEDSETNPEKAVTAANKLISIDEVPVLISSLSSVSMAVAPIAEKNEVFLLYSSTSRGIAEGKEYVFDGFPDARTFCEVATENAVERGTDRIAYMGDLEGGGAECELGIKTEMVALERFSIKDPGFRTVLTKIKEKEPEGLVIYTYSKFFPEIFETMIELDLDVKLIVPFNTGTASGDLKAVEIAEEHGLFEGAVGSDLYFDPMDAGVKGFIDLYRASYGEEPNGYSAYAYTNMKILLEVLDECGDSECIKEKLLTSEFEFVTGPTKFDKDGVAVLPVKTVEYSDGWR